MIFRSFDPNVLREAAAPYPELLNENFDFASYILNERNVLLTDELGNVGYFGYEYPGLYTAHYFMKSRGKDVVPVALEAFGKMFSEYGAESLRGLTKCSLKPAIFMARKIGFKSYGIVDTTDGPHELFIMTKQDYYDFTRENKN